MIYTKLRAKRTEVLNLLLELGLEWRPNQQFPVGKVFGHIFEQGGTKQASGFCSLPEDDREVLCDNSHRSLRWWGDYLQAVVYRLRFGELPKGHSLNFGIEDEGTPE